MPLLSVIIIVSVHVCCESLATGVCHHHHHHRCHPIRALFALSTSISIKYSRMAEKNKIAAHTLMLRHAKHTIHLQNTHSTKRTHSTNMYILFTYLFIIIYARVFLYIYSVSCFMHSRQLSLSLCIFGFRLCFAQKVRLRPVKPIIIPESQITVAHTHEHNRTISQTSGVCQRRIHWTVISHPFIIIITILYIE